MDKNISIYIITHKEDVYVPENRLFKLLQVGTANRKQPFPNMLHDNEGENISDKNQYYCELTGQYWVWKNCDADYYGFFHYRRYLSFAEKQFPIEFKPFIFGEVVAENNYSADVQKKYCFDEETMRREIEKYDFIAPAFVYAPGNATVYKQYESAFGHHIEDLDKVMYIIKRDYPDYVQATEKYIYGVKNYSCNMFIMNKELFFKYCEWLFDVLKKFEDGRKLEEYSSVDNRVVGYLAERLCGVFITYLYEKGYKGKELQRVYFLNTNQNESNSVKPVKKSGKARVFAGKVKRKAINVGTETAIRTLIKAKTFYRKKRDGIISLSTNCDNVNRSLNINLCDVIFTTNGFSTVRVFAEYFAFDEEKNQNDFEIQITDEKGNNVIQGDLIIIRENEETHLKDSDYYKKSILFSFKMGIFPVVTNIKIQLGDFSSVLSADAKVLEAKKREGLTRTANASDFPEYNNWFLARRISERELEFQRRHIFNVAPKYSIVVPLYKTPVEFFRDMADSVLNQSYPKLELILVNASPEDEKLKKVVEEYSGKDERIKVVALEENYGITENTNYGMDAATGDFICFLDHDDVLERDALFEYTKALNEHPDVDLFYCDEDKLYNGEYCDPYFKPDFNPDLLCGINYVCHFLAVRREIVEQIERPTKIYDGAQDHNMTFRVAEKARRAAHITRVLYHWRIHENSTAMDPEEKPYSMEAARLAVEHHLERCGIKAHAVNSQKVPRHYEVVYDLEEHPKVSIIIPTKNNMEMLKNCVDSIIRRSTYDNYEIVLVDNESTEENVFEYYKKLTEEFDFVKVLEYNYPFNFSSVVNYGVENCDGEYVLLLNNDTEVITDQWIEKMLGPCTRPEMGAVGAKLLHKDGTVQHVGVVINEIGPCHENYDLDRFSPGYYHTAVLPMDVSAVTGACIMSKKSVYQSVGGFDEAFATNYNDVDYCLKLRKNGYLILQNSFVELYHFETMTREKEELTDEGRIKFKKAYAMLLERYPEIFVKGDPYYNVNFAKNSIYFSL